MPETAKTPLAPELFRTPFSRAYWRCAFGELKRPKMLAVAAILLAVRVALKPVSITLSPTLSINFGFFVNALGAMIFGPVVAVLSAAVSDTLGCLLFPSGPYFFPFIFTEIAGSLLFALFLYRARLTGWRVTLARFAVCFLVNIVIQTPIMLWYYKLMLGKEYALFDLPRIAKNLVLFPFEALLLLLFLNVLRPVTYRMKLTFDPPQKLQITKRLVIFVVVLFLLGAAATGAYYVYDYQSYNAAKDFSEAERADFNRDLAARIGAGEDELVLVNTIHRSFFGSELEVTYSVYRIGAVSYVDPLWSMKNSEAKQSELLTLVEDTCTITIDP
ncbi:MAG: folate family ECF transporter S component [Oscillospiraceae bacterium]|nr:folate family ECF transporter S component [Oscillospiraceae bacterium]